MVDFLVNFPQSAGPDVQVLLLMPNGNDGPVGGLLCFCTLLRTEMGWHRDRHC